MFRRAGAGVCAAAIAGMLMMPEHLSARGAVGHPGGFRPMVRPMHRVHPPMARPVHRVPPNVRPIHHVHPPFAHRHHPPFAHRDFRERAFHAVRRHHRGVFGGSPFYGYPLPVTYNDDSAFYGSYYDPSDITGAIVVPAYAAPPAPVPSLAGLPEPPPERVGCRSQDVAVPSPSGAERSVTITRC